MLRFAQLTKTIKMKAKIIMEIKFSKIGLMRYISHLDLLRLFRRSASRARITLEHTCGFNPHPKISISRAIKLGETCEELFCQFGLKEKIEPQDFIDKLRRQLPESLPLTGARLIEKNN